jgi:PKD repeat protein
MKKSFAILITTILISFAATAQNGFIIEYLAGGPLYSIDLNTAQKTLIGNSINNLGAGDFGANDVLYAINSTANQFYEIDTLTGGTTLIDNITPPTNHMWTGMAYDEVNEIMYGYSAHAIASGEGSLHIIDVNDGTYTLVGTQTTATAIGCIAIDGTGQMYGLQEEANAKIYQIDKDNGAVTLVGAIGQGAAGMGHGMDWSNSNQTMYLVTYNSSTFANTLRTVNLTSGSTVQIGGYLGGWMGLIAIPGNMALSADFTTDVTDVCAGGVVNYINQSSAATSWSWTFESGTPATSTDENPTITYNTTGTFDVTLEVSDGTTTNTDYRENYITVTDIPVQPDTPDGPIEACTSGEYTYTTLSVSMADSYLWEVLPSDAGVITGTGISAIYTSSDTWTGTYTVKVSATNSCGTSTWSTELSCTLDLSPTVFFLSGTGSYCEGGSGMEVTLDGSETGVDYELFFENISTSTIIAGTGSSISFGFHTDEGLYTVEGFTSSCTELMFGEAYISIEYTPATGSQPTGTDVVCPGSTTDYQTEPIPEADVITWVLSPSNAGVIIGSGENISIEWSATYNGLAYLSVYGSNDCGDGSPSDDLVIDVLSLPQPEINGETMVCEDHENIYSTIETPGSTYTWEIEGGNITSGTGTSEITILWTTIGTGTILVTEISAETCEGSSDTFQVTVDDCTGIYETDFIGVKLFPNPANSNITISFTSNNANKYELNIYNQFAQQVYNAKIVSVGGQESHQIDVASLPIGLYFIKMVNSSNDVYQTRFEVIR